MKKRLLATITTFCLLAALFPASAFAADYTEVTEDGGQATTDLTYTTPDTHGSTGNFKVRIPTAVSWTDGDGDFYVYCDDRTSLDDGFQVNVTVDNSSYVDGLATIRLAASDHEHYIDFSVINSLNQQVSADNPYVGIFTKTSAEPDGAITMHMLTNNSDDSLHEYTGSMTFNISSRWN